MFDRWHQTTPTRWETWPTDRGVTNRYVGVVNRPGWTSPDPWGWHGWIHELDHEGTSINATQVAHTTFATFAMHEVEHALDAPHPDSPF